MTLDYKAKLNRLENRALNSYRVEEVYEKDLSSIEIKKFLNFQNQIPIKDILNIIKITQEKNLPIGYVMKHNNSNSIVGFVGTLFSNKKNSNLICNIHSWIVHPSHRIYSFFLISKLLKKKIFLTAFTPILSLKGLLTKCGFQKKIIYEKFLINLIPYFVKKNKYTLKEINDFKSLIKIRFENKKVADEKIIITGTISKKKKVRVFKILSVSKIKLFKKNFTELINLISKQFNLYFFSEYLLEGNKNFTPPLTLLSFKKRREIFLKLGSEIDKDDLLNSDLAI